MDAAAASGRQATAASGAQEQDGDATSRAERRALLEAELAKVRHARRALEREGRRMPWLSSAALLAVPVGVLWGLAAALFVAAAAVTVAVVGAYINWAHRQEYSDAETLIRQRLRDLERAGTAGGGARRGPAWRVPGKALALFES